MNSIAASTNNGWAADYWVWTLRELLGKNVVISTGTRARLDPIPGLAEAQPLTHIEALELDEVPKHLTVIEGGYAGLELSQAMRRFGSNITVIDRNDRLAHHDDDDATEGLHTLFRDEGLEVILNASIQRISGNSYELSSNRAALRKPWRVLTCSPRQAGFRIRMVSAWTSPASS